jgi:hypothetical protein
LGKGSPGEAEVIRQFLKKRHNLLAAVVIPPRRP